MNCSFYVLWNAYMFFHSKKLFSAVHNFVHLNLAIALFVGYLIFAFGVELAKDNEVLESTVNKKTMWLIFKNIFRLPAKLSRLLSNTFYSLPFAGWCVREWCSTSCLWWSSQPSVKNGGSSFFSDGVSALWHAFTLFYGHKYVWWPHIVYYIIVICHMSIHEVL